VVARVFEHNETSVAWEAFVDTYRESMPDVYRYLYRATGGDVPLAEDLTQATFTTAVRAVRSGRIESLTSAWLHTVARSRLIDHFRRAAREESKLSIIHGQRQRSVDIPEDLSVDEARAALRRLPTSQRAALVLRYLDDLPMPEVATALGRSVRATESLLARSRAAFRAAYEEQTDA
jgi:RNA polymerase sigma-70 factor (ECF subfamily)